MSWRQFYSVVLLVILASQLVLAKKGGDGKCQVCQSFVDSFKAGLKNTENSHFAGGDTSWEEKNQPVYADSEVRLIEILESICGSTDYKCTRFMDNNEEDIEKWWLKLRRNGHDDFEKWLCFDHLKVCCPKGTYGPNCIDCPGGSISPCSGHGTCQGSGEIDGKGVCKCDDGYKGSLCDECKEGYYYEEDNCKSCDKSCKNGCTGSGPQQCVECANGYTREETHDNDDDDHDKEECEDIDECEDETAKCKDGTYCHNTPGSYDCKDCDKSCKDVCTSRGPSGCVECGHGYEDKSGYCMDINECTEGTSDCKDGTYCENTSGSYKCEGCDESCLLTCTKSGPSGCDLCKEGYTMKDDACEDLDECASYPLPCDEESEFCSNLKGSFACKCKAGYTRVEGKCTTWQKAEEIREQKSEKKTKKKKKKSGKKQPAVTQGQDQSNSDLSPENGDQDGSINQDYIPSTDNDDAPSNDINDTPPIVSAGHNEL